MPSSEVDLDALLMEQRRRWQERAPITVEALLAQHPALRERKELLLDLINHEIVLRCEFDTPPACAEYVQRFPDLQQDLVLLFDVQDVLAHDSADESTFDTLDSGAHAAPPALTPPAAPAAAFPSYPGYQIHDVLGRGGMGIVYRAYDLQRKRFVALKTMQLAEAATLFRFKQEFRALAGLAHPNLATLYEFISDGQEWFFTMELVEGVSFLHYVRSPRAEAILVESVEPNPDDQRYETSDETGLPELDAADSQLQVEQKPFRAASCRSVVQVQGLREALKQLTNGVLALHDAGKLHRDIKPGNVLVTRQGRVVLLDFGLTAELDRFGQHQSTEQHLLGTIAYMAPEQAASQPVSPASDWYAVGVMLYEALTGRLPFEGPPLDVLMRKQRFDPPAPRALDPAIPEDLSKLCEDMLRRNPQERPSGRDILQRLAGSESVVTQHAPPKQSSFIGRKSHLHAMAEAFQHARQGHTVVLHVHGPSGVGKSSLVRCFLDQLLEREEAVVLAGRCYEQEAVPYKSLDSLVDALSRYLLRLSALEAEALLPRDVLALARVFPVLRRVGAVAQAQRRSFEVTDPQEVRRRALAALRELLGRLGNRRSLVLFIDDLHWGDADSAALLDNLLRPPDSPALLLLVVYRTDDASAPACPQAVSSGVWSEDSAPSAPTLLLRRLAVEPLTLPEAHDLVLTLLNEAHREAKAQAERIAHESEGNPLFLYELVQHVQSWHVRKPETEVRKEDGTVLSMPSVETALPASEDISLHEVLWVRILRLPDAARRLLEVVTVAGRPIRQADACQAAELTSEELSALDLLRSARFVRGTGPVERNEIETFHGRIRETVLAHLSPAALEQHHRKLAQTLEATGQADPERLAIHFQHSQQSSQAGKYYAQAAAQAADALAFDRAAKLYRLALAMGTEDETSATPRGWRTCLGDALANAGRGAEAAREYLAVAADAPPAEALELQRRAALQFLISGHVDQGLACLRSVLSAVGMRLPRTPRRAFWSLVLRRVQLHLRGLGYRPRNADEVAAEELNRINICWSASAGLSMVDTIQGAYFQTRGLLLALAAGEPYHLARALAMEAGHVSIGGGKSRHRTARLLQAAEIQARQAEHPYPRGMVALASGIAAAFEGNWPGALALCDQAESIFRDACTGVVWELDTAHRFALWALMFMGQVPEMARRVPVLLQEAQERDDVYAVTNLSMVVGTFITLAADEPERARADVEQVMARWSRQGFHVQHLNSLSDLALIDLYEGTSRAAWDRLQEQWPLLAGSHFFRVQQVRVVLWHLRARSALAAAGTGDAERFLRIAEQDACRLRKERIAWSEALSFLIEAGVAAARGRPAIQLLHEAARACDAVEMPLHAAAARRAAGGLMGGAEGEALLAQVEAWMKSRRIQNPVRIAAMLVPGFV